jgi:membrane fusion protein (multidrug efflux system)
MPVNLEVVPTERMSDLITAVGTIRADERVEVRSEVSGRVREIRFREGARVAAGDVLLKIDDSELRAQLARAESRQAIAEREEKRQRELYDRNVSSSRDLDNAVTNLAVAKAEADLIRAQLAKTDIRAPFSGVVGLRAVSEGTYVTPATPITTVVDDNPVKIDFVVPERFAGQLKAGDAIRFTVEGLQHDFAGTVYALEPAIDEQTRTLGVRATSPNNDGTLVPGAFAQVEVGLPEREALTVPAFALLPEIRGHRVFVMRGGKAEPKSVRIGARSTERVEVLDGLAAGDTLILSGLMQMRPGAAVTLAPAKDAK